MPLVKEAPRVRPMAASGGREVAVTLGVSEGTVDSYINDGSLPIGGVRPNSRKYFYGKSIIACWKKHNYG